MLALLLFLALDRPVSPDVVREVAREVIQEGSGKDKFYTALAVAVGAAIIIGRQWWAEHRVQMAVEAAEQRMRLATEAAAKKLAQAAEQVQKTVAETTRAQASAVREVKATLEDTTAQTQDRLDRIEDVGDKNHVLLNSGLGAELLRLAEKSERVAALDPTEKNIEDARADRETSDRHAGKQAEIEHAQKQAAAGEVIVQQIDQRIAQAQETEPPRQPTAPGKPNF